MIQNQILGRWQVSYLKIQILSYVFVLIKVSGSIAQCSVLFFQFLIKSTSFDHLFF